MAKPSDSPTWATDADYPAGPNGWNETDTKVEPSGGKQAEGFEPSERPPAQYLNWWMNLVYLWIAWLDSITGTRTRIIAPSAGMPRTTTVAWSVSGVGGIEAVDLAWMVCIDFLDVGDHISEIRATVQDSVTSPEKVSMQLYSAADGSLVTDYGTVLSSGDGTLQVITLTIDASIEAGQSYELVFFPDDDNGDVLKLFQIEIDHDANDAG
jgi:hypothetical protein